MNSRIKDKIILITGASRGLGEQIAWQTSKSGARLVLVARNLKKLNELRDKLQAENGGDVYAYQLDISDRNAVTQVFMKIEQDVGPTDILVNNAGFGVFDKVIDADLDEAEAMFQTNVLGLMACTKMVLPSMLERGRGHIINVASQAGKLATPKSSVYAATKHAVLGYTNALRMELHGTNISVTAVNPGPIQTSFFEIADKEGTYVKNVERFLIKPEQLAAEITKAMLTTKREINRPYWMHLGSKIHSLFPRTFETLGRRQFNKK